MVNARPSYEYTYIRSVSHIKNVGTREEIFVGLVSLRIVTNYIKDGRPWKRIEKGTPAIYIEKPIKDCPKYLLDVPCGDIEIDLDVYQYESLNSLYKAGSPLIWQLVSEEKDKEGKQ